MNKLNKLASLLMILALFGSFVLLPRIVKTALAVAPPSPSLVVRDNVNRINATSGVKSGSQITVKGTVKNIALVPWFGLLTGVFFRENAPGLVPGDLTCEWSSDGIAWFPTGPLNVADPASGYQLELVIGPGGGYELLSGQNSTTYVRVTANKDIGISTGLLSDSVAVIVWQDHGVPNHWDVPADLGWILSQPPMYAGLINWDNPIKIDLQIWHTAEIAGTGKFYYSIQSAIYAANPGDTIWIYDGTYLEALYISKSLTLKAASLPVIRGGQMRATNYGNRMATIFVENAANVILEKLDVEGQGFSGKSYAILYENSNGAVKDCTSSPNTIGDMDSVAIAAWDNSKLTIQGCTVKNFGRIGIYSNNATLTIAGNTIIGQVYNLDNLVNYGIEIEDYTGPSIANITMNKIYNCNNTHPSPQWSSAAIIADTWREWADVYGLKLFPSKVSITYNDIYDNYEAIELVSNDLSYARYNNFYNNTWGVWSAPENWTTNPTYYVFDARHNWWGHPTGPNHPTSWLYMGSPYGPNPGLGDIVSDYVLYKPWMKKSVVPPLVHDVAVITAPIPTTYKIQNGTTIQVDVTVKNKGTAYENFTVTLYYDSTVIDGIKPVTDLGPGETLLLTFNWNTTGVVQHQYYILKATASTVPGETNTADNTNINPTPVLVGSFDTPTLKVEPAVVPNKILFVNETFKVNITMNNLSEDWHVAGAQVVLSFNTTLIQFVNVTEGTFFSGFKHATQSTLSGYFVEGSYVVLMVYLSPNENGTYPEWPRGNGVIATITFKVLINVPRGSVASCALTICNSPYFDTMLLDHEMEKIPFNVESGTCRILGTNLADINYDGKVDIQDLSRVSAAFGSYPGHPKWNPACDINGDGKIDINDVARVSKQFGWYRKDP